MILSWLFDAIVGPDGPAVRAMLEECDRKEKEEKKFKRNKNNRYCGVCPRRDHCRDDEKCKIF